MSVAAVRVADQLHPRLAALRDNPDGERGFWGEIACERAPLIEPDPQTPGYSLVTFVFPAPAAAHHVVVSGAAFRNAPDHVMQRIPGTRVCYAAYRCRNDMRMAYSFSPDLPLISADDATESELAALTAFLRDHPGTPDPHCRDHFLVRYNGYAPDRDTSVLSLQDAPDQSLVYERKGVARGQVRLHTFHSVLLRNERRIWVYTPPGYATSYEAGYPVLVNFDGGSALSARPTQIVLDNLLADSLIRPHVAVFIDNPTPASRDKDLHCSEPFARFVEEELLLWLRANYRLSDDAKDYTVTGASAGGLTALWFGLRLPHVFGVVISQAAALWWAPGWVKGRPLSAQTHLREWLIDQYVAAPRQPVRIWMEIGLLEHPDRMLGANRRMKAVLEAKGYDLNYSEPCGGHDYATWRGTFGHALARMLPADA